MQYLAPHRIGSTGPKMADNVGAEMVPPCRQWPPLELAEKEQPPWTEWSKQEEIEQTRKQFGVIMSEAKDENWTEEAEAIQYVGACSRGTACRYSAEGSSKNSQESIKDLHRWWLIMYQKLSNSSIQCTTIGFLLCASLT